MPCCFPLLCLRPSAVESEEKVPNAKKRRHCFARFLRTNTKIAPTNAVPSVAADYRIPSPPDSSPNSTSPRPSADHTRGHSDSVGPVFIASVRYDQCRLKAKLPPHWVVRPRTRNLSELTKKELDQKLKEAEKRRKEESEDRRAKAKQFLDKHWEQLLQKTTRGKVAPQ